MSSQGYECNSCGYILFIENDTRKSLWCPRCRATLYPADIQAPEECIGYHCEECGAEFSIQKGAQAPYKCPRCNFTFPSTPDRRVRHKL